MGLTMRQWARVGETSFPALSGSYLHLLKIKNNGSDLKGQDGKPGRSPAQSTAFLVLQLGGSVDAPLLFFFSHLPYTRAGVGDSTTISVII